jgi:hypothetical protein
MPLDRDMTDSIDNGYLPRFGEAHFARMFEPDPQDPYARMAAKLKNRLSKPARKQ